jgi:two-component system sensor kinase FixL
VTGWRRDEIIGQSFACLYSLADRAAGMPERDLACAIAGDNKRRDVWRVRHDGTEFPAEMTLSALRDGSGRLAGFGHLLVDISERKAAEEALIRSEAHLRTMLATVPDGMIVIDERGIILSANAAAQRIFGFDEAEMAGRNVAMLMMSREANRHDGYIQRYMATGERHIIGIGRVLIGRHRDGHEIPLEISLSETSSHGHRIFTGFIRDLTDQRRSETKVRELQSELIHVTRLSAMGAMASTLAHELSQPLTAITNYLETCRDFRDLDFHETPATVRHALDCAAHEAIRAGAILRRTRDFAARGEIDLQARELRETIDDACRLALIGAAERGVNARLCIHPPVGKALIDRIQIQQVILNLVRNAIEAVDGQPVRDISVSARTTADGMIKITVADTGPGIADTIRDRLFEAFATTKRQGTGLGLSICRTIVEAHGGRIWVGNGRRGARFHFTVLAADKGNDP